jgi:hypothetical protein
VRHHRGTGPHHSIGFSGREFFIEANEPRLMAFNEYATDEGTEVVVVQVHPGADSFEFHMGGVRERAYARAYDETLDATTGIQVFGAPTESMRTKPIPQ